MADEDYYALLGIDAAADAAQVRRAFRKLALRWHPDRAGAGATAQFQKLSAAYEVLSDPAARAAYDSTRPRPAPKPPPGRAPGVMLHRLSGPLNALQAQGVARRAKDGVIELFVRPEEAEQGGMAAISMPVQLASGGEALYSAWLAIRPGVTDGVLVAPSSQYPGVSKPVEFRIRRRS